MGNGYEESEGETPMNIDAVIIITLTNDEIAKLKVNAGLQLDLPTLTKQIVLRCEEVLNVKR